MIDICYIADLLQVSFVMIFAPYGQNPAKAGKFSILSQGLIPMNIET